MTPRAGSGWVADGAAMEVPGFDAGWAGAALADTSSATPVRTDTAGNVNDFIVHLRVRVRGSIAAHGGATPVPRSPIEPGAASPRPREAAPRPRPTVAARTCCRDARRAA